MTWRAFVAVSILILITSCTFCAIQPEPDVAVIVPITRSVAVPHLGGPLYRVFDVDEIDSIEALYAVEQIYRSAEQCTGIKHDFALVRVFFASKIMILTENGWREGNMFGSRYVGMRAWNRPWIYLLRPREANAIAWTMKHEFVHYLTDMGHPEADDALRACGVHREAKIQ